MPINPRWIDIDLEPAGMRPGGIDDRSFGIPFPRELIVPRDEWRDRIQQLQEHDPFSGPHPKGCIVANHAVHVFDQTPESSCVLNATAGAIMRCWAVQVSLEHAIVLSPMASYAQLARSRHSGTYMWSALQLTQEKGMLPSDKHGQAERFLHTFHENTPFVWPRSLPDGWEQTARHFRPIEWLRIDDESQFGSALLNQYPVVYGRSGHSIVGEDMVYDSGRFLCRSCDSYGFNRRDGTGRIYDSRRNWATGGAWALRAVTYPHDPERPAGERSWSGRRTVA